MLRENLENQNLNESELSDSFDESSCENHNEVDALNEEATILENEFLLYPETPKNKFLFPEVKYGKIENELKEYNQATIICIHNFDIVVDESKDELDQLNKETTNPNYGQIGTNITTKNKFLYPDDGLGKMERGCSF